MEKVHIKRILIINWNKVVPFEPNIDLIRMSHYIERFLGSVLQCINSILSSSTSLDRGLLLVVCVLRVIAYLRLNYLFLSYYLITHPQQNCFEV